MNALSRTVTFKARPGNGHELAERLLGAAALVAETSGCEQWLVYQDSADPDVIRVSEIWASRKQCDAALQLDGVPETMASVTALLDGEPAVVAGELLGGARVVRGSAGASRFSIPDAPDLPRTPIFCPDMTSERSRPLATCASSSTRRRSASRTTWLPPGKAQGWAHRHTVVEEIYVALSGSGSILVDGQPYELQRLDVVRVAPASVRELQAEADGLEVLVFGTHSPGDGKMVAQL